MKSENDYHSILEAARQIAEDPNKTSLFQEVADERTKEAMAAKRIEVKEKVSS